MRVFLGFLKKETFHVLRDRRTLLVLFGLPLVQMVLFGYALRNEVVNLGPDGTTKMMNAGIGGVKVLFGK